MRAQRVGPSVRSSSRLLVFAPALAAILYPFLLQAFHVVIGSDTGAGRIPLATALLLAAFAVPALGLLCARRFEGRARLLALLSIASPPLFVLISVVLSLLGLPLRDLAAWVVVWLTAGVWTLAGPGSSRSVAPRIVAPPGAFARVIHGVVAAALLVFIGFHLTNHLLGLLGPETHAAIMKVGREVYRAPVVEALLVALLLIQVGLGGWLAWRWSRQPLDDYRAVQVATGVYLGFFVLTHLNSALVSARAVHGIDTNWAWASGAPEGLLRDAWNIRLLPHYALGVFCALTHLLCGFREVLLKHGAPPARANLAWKVGALAAAGVTVIIISGLCGVRT